MSKKAVRRRSAPLLQSIRQVREWEDEHLPQSQSRIAYDLFVLIAHSAVTERPLTLKELFNSLKYSQRGVRYVLDQFIDGGWCEIVESDGDKRFRLVVATDRLHSTLNEYEKFVMSVYGQLKQRT